MTIRVSRRGERKKRKEKKRGEGRGSVVGRKTANETKAEADNDGASLVFACGVEKKKSEETGSGVEETKS